MKIFGEVEAEIELARRLEECESVRRHTTGDHREGYALAHSLADIEGSCRKLLDSQLPRLLSTNLTCGEVRDALLDIGETYRGMLEQIRGPLFYKYLPRDSEMDV